MRQMLLENSQFHFCRQVNELLADGWRVVPGTMFCGSLEFAPRERTRPVGDRETDGKRNKRSVWSIATSPTPEAHFATFPPKLIEPCIIAGCPEGGVVLDPFSGAGTTAMVCKNLGRKFVGCELNPEYIAISEKRIGRQEVLF